LTLQRRAGLTPDELAAIAGLEQRVVAADGGRLKLEWDSLRGRSGEAVEDVLWWDSGQLVGFLGLYAFGGANLELAGMVDPLARRRGIATALLDTAAELARERGRDCVLLVCPRATETGAGFAAARAAALDHSEHALVLGGEPVDGAADPSLVLRPARDEDGDDVNRLLEAGFGHRPAATRPSLEHGHYVVERDGSIVSYLRLTMVDGVGGVYGFVVDPQSRGRGIGRDVLRRACRQLRGQGAERVGLEVAVENEHALGLYTSLGFEPVVTEDYYRLPV
jgi:ribosomal protein S18 acetylase RimI-like enzyme